MKEKKQQEIQDLVENPPAASVASEHFNELARARKFEMEQIINDPAPLAMEHFTRKAEEEKSKRNLRENLDETVEPSLATQHFVKREQKTVEEKETMRSQIRKASTSEVVEPLPFDHFTKLGEAETKAKAAAAWAPAKPVQAVVRPMPKRKKCQYGKRRKKSSKTQRNLDVAAALNNPPLIDVNPDLDDPMVLDAEPVVILLSMKNARTDDNWRTNRAVQAREREIEKLKKKGVDEEKVANKRLASQRKKTARAERAATKEKEKTEDAKEKLQLAEKKRVSAEKKVTPLFVSYCCYYCCDF